MPNESFQHTEPMHVYRFRYRRLLAIIVIAHPLLLIAVTLLYWLSTGVIDRPSPILVIAVLFNIVMFFVINVREKLIISPAGVSITHLWRTAATPWSNVAGSQIFTTNLLGLKTHMPSLVLYSPPLGNLSFYKVGIPIELHDRVLPIQFRQWERPNEIEQGLRHYLSQREDGGLLVPYGFAAVPDPNEKRNIIIGLIVGVLVASFMYAFWF